jgi:hypothetical protein
VTWYVRVDPFCAVTTTLIVFVPTESATAPEGDPEVTAAPSTVTVARELHVVGVTVIDDVWTVVV